jgi:cytochrome P450
LGDDRYAGDNREAFQPFSVGPRNCIGRSLAYMESRLIIARLVWNFNLELMPESLDWNVQKTWVLSERGPLKARLTPVRPVSVQQLPESVVSEKAAPAVEIEA